MKPMRKKEMPPEQMQNDTMKNISNKSVKNECGDTNNKNYYVYLHKRADDGLIFNVGKGKDKRAWTTAGRSRWWINVKNKHGLVVEIIESELTEEEALAREISLIAEGRKLGWPLVNLTKGGEGSSGRKLSAETLKRMSDRFKGIPLSAEHRQKLSDAKLGKPRILTDEQRRKIGDRMRGKKLSPEARAKISRAKRNRPPMSLETRAKLSRALKGRKSGPRSAETVERLRAASHRWHTSPEYHDKMSKAAIKMWNSPDYRNKQSNAVIERQKRRKNGT